MSIISGANLDVMNTVEATLNHDCDVRRVAKQVIREDICGRVRHVPANPHTRIDEIIFEYASVLHC